MEEICRWKLICKALVQVRIRRPPVLQGVYPSVLRSQISIWNKNVGLCHSKAKNCISPALQSHEKFEGTWASPFMFVTLTRICQGHLGIKSIYKWCLIYGRKILLPQKCPNELCWWTKKNNTENKALESLYSQKGVWCKFEPFNL